MARNFAEQGLDLDIDVLAASMKGALAGQPSQLSPEQIQAAMQQLQAQFGGGEERGRRPPRPTAMQNNKAEGEAFLAEKPEQAGHHHLTSGLQYRVLTEGAGEKPGPRSEVTTH
ncbi:FKBP-type peptidyl-prolyl cis-trans isomerase N-terminal domain-containing protein [Hymenobacter sp. J193]|uniref:FKBP-type peptidyl-prolyl cis-trans isomerase N-terminal domain-containing protein n=1 Tax=Hymenobacter sp. J193 TaxID=2898429 RepID=UPI00215072FC|nr:FKBP-type peptidyl-prolyl cis-trans isomerase N-terminal domain-containing protein [Hymenobacter sp. J193]MCR5890263.1 FKBP-type peptidyl-prolyl cis-trans isomerase N-terminal domain-containing protein [Hymenobacter sp. J193]